MEDKSDFYRDIFEKYYSNFDDSLYGIRIKYDHTMRVVSLAGKISVLEGQKIKDNLVAIHCALFHDIARFKQWNEYKTFEDGLSFDHGDEGEKILKSLGIDDEIILLSTKYHNKYKLPEGLDERTKMFCNITRDADKLDNLCMPVSKLHGEDGFIEEAINSIMNKEMVKNNVKYKDNLNFHILRELGFIFDLNFKASFKILKEKNAVRDLISAISLRGMTSEQIDKIDEVKNFCIKYIDERISE